MKCELLIDGKGLKLARRLTTYHIVQKRKGSIYVGDAGIKSDGPTLRYSRNSIRYSLCIGTYLPSLGTRVPMRALFLLYLLSWTQFVLPHTALALTDCLFSTLHFYLYILPNLFNLLVPSYNTL